MDQYLKKFTDLLNLIKKLDSNHTLILIELMNNAVCGKTMENVRNHRDIKIITIKARRNYLVSEPNHHITKFFTEIYWPQL